MPMREFFNQVVQFLQPAISAIFRFIQLVWTWSIDQMTKVMQVPWQTWPLFKQILLILIAIGVFWALYRAAKEFWEAGERILHAFATLLAVLVRTIPSVILAGVIALGGLWLLNNLDLSSVRLPASLRVSSH
jgi:ABC-type arginine transport system permease subunit